MKKLRRIIAVILLIFVLCLVGYTAHTCSLATENITMQTQYDGGGEVG